MVRGVRAGAELRGGEAELVLRLQLHVHRRTPGHGRQGPVAHKGGHGDDHLIAGVEDAPQGQVDGFAAAHGDHNLMGEVVLQAEAAVQVGRDLPRSSAMPALEVYLVKPFSRE